MINLNSYLEWCLELVNQVNSTSQYKIDSFCTAVSEAHMVKKLASEKGIVLCTSYPDARGVGSSDSLSEIQQGFFFIVQKVSPGTDNNGQEIARYARLQSVALALRDAIFQSSCTCFELNPGNDYRIDWEWQIFGGFNGLSIGFKFKNND